ncbi:MAG TPA: DUF5606 domain-containing protein [Bacteroidia bacterium]|nr:DUF5606 domain-containing protein [Bacteroidia bacterium]HNU34404.1 DUF5606 domain-containing protein [Bacteroidia bacterium]
MGLKGVMHIAGMSGLHKVIAQTKTGFVAESLIDKKRFAVSSTQRVSMLEDISVFTTGEDVKLAEVFKKMQGMNQDSLSLDKDADGATTMNYFSKILPDFDKDRVYASDIKKIAKWYELVKDMLLDDEKNTSEVETADANEDEGNKNEGTEKVKTSKTKKKED